MSREGPRLDSTSKGEEGQEEDRNQPLQETPQVHLQTIPQRRAIS